MAKKPKVIELVFKAQPAMALLYKIMKDQKKDDVFVKDIENWLASAREVLSRKS